MHLWFLQPFPVPFPAPSYIGLMTASALLGVVPILFPRLRVVLRQKQMEHSTQWILLCVGVAFVGVTVLSIWGTLAELPIAFLWSAIWYGALTGLRLVLQPFMKHTS